MNQIDQQRHIYTNEAARKEAELMLASNDPMKPANKPVSETVEVTTNYDLTSPEGRAQFEREMGHEAPFQGLRPEENPPARPPAEDQTMVPSENMSIPQKILMNQRQQQQTVSNEPLRVVTAADLKKQGVRKAPDHPEANQAVFEEKPVLRRRSENQQGTTAQIPVNSNTPPPISSEPPVVPETPQISEEELLRNQLAEIQVWKQRGYDPVTLQFPSGGVFYSNPGTPKDILVRDTDYDDLIRLAGAIDVNNKQTIYEVIGQTVLNFRWSEMVTEDFMYLLFYHRQRTRDGDIFEITWPCNDIEHINSVIEGELDEDTLSQRTKVNPKMMKMETKGPSDFKKAAELATKFPDMRLYPARIGDELELMAYRDTVLSTIPPVLPESTLKERMEIQETTRAVNEQINEYRRYAKDASMLSPDANQGELLKDRINYLRDLFRKIPRSEMLDRVKAIHAFRKASECSISEFVKVKCEVCKAEQDVAIEFDPAQHFLPSEFTELERDTVPADG